MVETLTSIYRGEGSLPMQGIWAKYRGRPARARWGLNNRSVAQPTECFHGGARAIGTFPGKHRAIRCRATALRSPNRHFRLGQRLQHGQRLRTGVDVMQFVSYTHVPWLSRSL